MGRRTTSQDPWNGSVLLNKQSPELLACESSGCGQSTIHCPEGPLGVSADTISQNCRRHPVALTSFHLMRAEAEGLSPSLKNTREKKMQKIKKEDDEILPFRLLA